MRRCDFLIHLTGPATLPVISPLWAAINITRVGEPRRESYRTRFSRRRADHQAPQLWVLKQLEGAYYKGGYHVPFRQSFNRRHYRHGTY
jgi:hypothetical protein